MTKVVPTSKRNHHSTEEPSIRRCSVAECEQRLTTGAVAAASHRSRSRMHSDPRAREFHPRICLSGLLLLQQQQYQVGMCNGVAIFRLYKGRCTVNPWYHVSVVVRLRTKGFLPSFFFPRLRSSASAITERTAAMKTVGPL